MTTRMRLAYILATGLVLIPAWAPSAPTAASAASKLTTTAASSVSKPTSITDCNDDVQLRADAAAGGSYAFTCDGVINVATNGPIIRSGGKPLSIDATGHTVLLENFGTGRQVFQVMGGSVTLRGLQFVNAYTTTTLNGTPAGGADGAAGASGPGGSPGANGTSTASGAGSGGDGTAGGNGGASAASHSPGKAVQGGALYVAAGATVSLIDDTFNKDQVIGGNGGAGGASGFGGNGGSGGSGADAQGTGAGGHGGNGAAGGNTTNGSDGANGGDGEGGAVYNAGTLSIVNTTFSNDQATGGQGGAGGAGGGNYFSNGNSNYGVGGSGGFGGFACQTCALGSGGNGADGGNGGNGGNGGDSGNGLGGAIYNKGKLTVTGSQFESDKAIGETGGTGSPGGDGGNGGNGGGAYCWNKGTSSANCGQGGNGGNGGNAGNGGLSGRGGNGYGGAIYSTVPFTQSANTTTTNSAEPGGGGCCLGFGGTGGRAGVVTGGHLGKGGTAGSNGSSEPAGASGKSGYPDFFPDNASVGISGTVLRGSKVGVADNPAKPVPGATVTATGTTSAGKRFSGSDTTDGSGNYSISAPKGSYSVTFPRYVCAKVAGTVCKQSAKVTVGTSATTLDAVALIGVLTVTVTPAPRRLTLKLDKDTGKPSPEPVSVTINVTNTGKAPVDTVTPPPKLIVGYSSDAPPGVPYVPLRPFKGPLPAGATKTLAPGKSTKFDYVLKAEGDGKYDIQALVIGSQPGIKRITGVGQSQVLIGSPVVLMTTKIGREVHSPSYPKLVLAGTAFTINVTVQNLSYVKEVAVAPYYPDLSGNAFDGHVQYLNEPIQNVAGLAAADASEWVELAPRETVQLESVIHTTSTPADVLVGQNQSGGGTRADVTIGDPEVMLLKKDGTLGAKVPTSDVFVDGETHYQVSLDDSDFRTPPPDVTYVGEYWYLSKGVIEGCWNLTAGGLAQLFKSIPSLVSGGITAVNYGLESVMEAEMELWEEAKSDPALMAQFLSLVDNAAILSYRHAPKLIGNVSQFYDQINKSVLDGYTKTANDWYSGDWPTAMTEFAREGTERTGDVAMALAPGILVRDAKVLAAFAAAKEALYAQITEDLAAFAPKIVDVFESLSALQKIVKPGYQFTATNLRQLFGLTYDESQFLRQFAKDNRLLIVVRSRAAESVRWIKKFGAVLKPEAIKIKNVSLLDAKYLGFADSDVGRVVIRLKLPSVNDVEALLRKNGFGPADAEWSEALKRLEQRSEELTKTKDGYVPQLQQAAKDGYMDMNWNFADNSVDPTAYTKGSPTRYEFRLAPDDGTGNLVPEYLVNGKWRSITGDVDFLQITRSNGAALTDAQRVKIYQQLSESVIGFMHPESATWTDLKNNLFDFPTKVNEFVRAGTVAQFGPDGVVRAALFNPSRTKFVSKRVYRIAWDGGYVNPLGTTAP